MKTATLNITCPDKKGLVADLTQFVFHNRGNILALDQYVDEEEKVFFMRLEWDMRGFKISRKELLISLKKHAKGKAYAGGWELFFSDVKPRMAILVSKHDHCLFDLLLRHKSGELNCDIPLIISNHNETKTIADMFGVDFCHIPVPKKGKASAEKRQLKTLAEYNVDFIVLARYMQILSGKFIAHFKSKIINVHHSFLPAFKGAGAYRQAWEKGVKVIGATSHFVTTELDHGPIICQKVEGISHLDTVDDLMRKGKDLERTVLAEATRLFIEHRLFIYKGKTVIF
ncbi:MAG: formyltetrahydrofolate deformylase [Pseudomonadota bacterium]